jgi:hypothetical protein
VALAAEIDAGIKAHAEVLHSSGTTVLAYEVTARRWVMRGGIFERHDRERGGW